jgi:hypothetical protein
MLADGFRLYAEGSAVLGDVQKTFHWGFNGTVAHARCVDVSSDQEITGLVVPDGGEAIMQATIHGDHLFYDDLQSPAAQARFQHIADADADADGEVTLAELDAVPLANIPPEQGSFGVGASDVNDLGAYVRAATHTVGHYNGEGHCETHSE